MYIWKETEQISFSFSHSFTHSYKLLLTHNTYTHTKEKREREKTQPASVITKATVCHADAITKGIYSDLFCLPTCTTTTTITPNIFNFRKNLNLTFSATFRSQKERDRALAK